MSDEPQLERIFITLDALAKEQVTQGKILVRIETNLTNHLITSVSYREKVEAHDQFVTRAKTVGGIFAGVWTLALGWMWKKIVGG